MTAAAAARRVGGFTGLPISRARFFDERYDFSDFRFHRRPSCPLISEASGRRRGHGRAGQVFITSASKSSLAFGASAIPTSIESKWLRT